MKSQWNISQKKLTLKEVSNSVSGFFFDELLEKKWLFYNGMNVLEHGLKTFLEDYPTLSAISSEHSSRFTNLS